MESIDHPWVIRLSTRFGVDKMRQTDQRGRTRLLLSEHRAQTGADSRISRTPWGLEMGESIGIAAADTSALASFGGGPNVNSRSTVSKGVNLYRESRG